MALSSKPHCILMFMISFYTLTLFASALEVSDAVADAPGPGSGGKLMNVHCESSDDDLGLIHIPFGNSWGFRFRVNIWETTRFRCHFTWYFGGSHYFDIFICKECIWEVGRNNEDEAMCRITQDGSVRYCFTWDDDV
ncbi:hypothetical protein BRARA_G01668 [Brassica rapa]|uniref:S-protein homolog n=1 Tax=Brassica campestris TaxID=3711 RepID=A0A397YLS0_BRACM|nr:hypothetical protein BRARA_G01668 [Brassica rapa]